MLNIKPDVLLIHGAAERKAAAGGEARNQQRNAGEEQRARQVQFQPRPQNDPPQRQHHQSRYESLNQSPPPLFPRPPRRYRSAPAGGLQFPA